MKDPTERDQKKDDTIPSKIYCPAKMPALAESMMHPFVQVGRERRNKRGNTKTSIVAETGESKAGKQKW